jgi:hypothetical protein
LSLNLRFSIIAHAWRTLEFAFVLLHMRDALPGFSTRRAGVDDIPLSINQPPVAGRTFALILVYFVRSLAITHFAAVLKA